MTEDLRAKRVASCDGPGLRAALLAATAWLGQNAEAINALNVFPVPDGDTGSNMSLTLQSAIGEIERLPGLAGVGAVARAASHGALMGARGNSGVILSQVLRGIARGLDDKATLEGPDLAAALVEGAATAYRGVIKPVEGTILTVARESAAAAASAAQEGGDVVETLARAVATARESLARTPSLLPVLAEAGVVDAGGQGYLAFLEGLLQHFRGEAPEVGAPLEKAGESLAQTEKVYGYCTEFLLRGQDLDVDALRSLIVAQGESGLVVGDGNLLRVHVHTFDPGAILTAALKYGTLHKIKIDNMAEQHREFLLAGQMDAAVAPGEYPAAAGHGGKAPTGDVALVAVASGDGMTEVFRSLGASTVVPGGQTMNPSTGELLQAVESTPASAVVILPNNGNIVLTAQQVVPLSRKHLVVVPTRTVPQGVAALMAFNYEADLEANTAAMRKAAERVRTVEVTKAVRSVKMDGLVVAEGAAIALADGELVASGGSPDEAALSALPHCGVEHAELVTIYYGEGAGREAAEQLSLAIGQRWPGPAVEVIAGGQPFYPYIISVE